MGFEQTYTDPNGQPLHVRDSADHSPGAYLVPGSFDGFAVPAHRLAEFTGYLYQAAGQPVPDLPQIQDPEAIDLMVTSLAHALPETTGLFLPAIADAILADGWRKTP